ncbi:MAG: dipeptidyl peptidase 3, partial [Muribaculaceae bacterium]|nr:dipeptidyl peptidase 3 [Muribaculaceae bacterium]
MKFMRMTAAAFAVVLATTSAMANFTDPKNPSGTVVDRFADIEVMRYAVPGFEELSLDQKKLIYHLTEAALAGRDILWDQNGRYNLAVRDLLEDLYKNYKGDRNEAGFKAFEKYLKQVEFGNGVYHHYSTDKFTPGFTAEWLDGAMAAAGLQMDKYGDSATLRRLLFDPAFLPKRVNQAAGQDVIATSANNLYGPGITQAEVEAFYGAMKDTTDVTPVSYGLNAKVVKGDDGKLKEEVYKVGGLYSPAIERIVANLQLALPYAETPEQAASIEKLISFYRTGSLREFDEYSILWVGDTKSKVDFVNGFIESYGDPLGMTGSWEGIVNFRNDAASQRTQTISENAQWFENNSPVDPRFRKPHVKGVTAKVINAAILAGDSYPSSPIGINLPNANWIRAAHGSKSVTIENLTQAYDDAAHGNGFNEEFVIDAPTRELLDKYLFITDNLHTDLH